MKERNKERLESSLKKQTQQQSARESVTARVKELNSKAIKDYRAHIEDMR